MAWRHGLIAAVLVCAGARAATDQVIPFTMEEISGSRPVVAVSVNGLKLRAIVHSNAGMVLQINHAQAAAAGVRDMVHQDSYGIEAPGKVSALGRDTGILPVLEVGGVRDENVPVSIFEKPVDIAMLGLGWIGAHGLIVDFPRLQAVVPAGPSSHAALRARLLAEGYSAHVLRLDPADKRYLVSASLNGVSASFVVSTVVDVTIDSAFAAKAGLKPGRVTGEYGGPSGATGQEYESADAAVIAIDGWRSKPRTLPIEDTYAYSKAERPADPRGGYLGADFLIAHAAVIDFGAKVLYLR